MKQTEIVQTIVLFRRVNAMVYSNFTLETVRKTFQLEADEAADISSGIETGGTE